MKPEYRKGPEVAEKFEEAMKTLFRTPKPKIERQRASRGIISSQVRRHTVG
jgi:hypothetical protein